MHACHTMLCRSLTVCVCVCVCACAGSQERKHQRRSVRSRSESERGGEVVPKKKTKKEQVRHMTTRPTEPCPCSIAMLKSQRNVWN